MSDTEEGWKRVLAAFDDWIDYEVSEFGPWTAYFSRENLESLTDNERLGWMHSMYDKVIPGRVDACRNVRVALEDFLPHMPDPDSIQTVRSMLDLSVVIEELMLRMSDIIADMLESYSGGGLADISSQLRGLAEAEEEIRHHMSVYSQGFARLRALGLEVPEE